MSGAGTGLAYQPDVGKPPSSCTGSEGSFKWWGMKECIDSGDMITGDDVGADANLKGLKEEPQAGLEEELRSSGGGTDPSSTAGIEGEDGSAVE